MEERVKVREERSRNECSGYVTEDVTVIPTPTPRDNNHIYKSTKKLIIMDYLCLIRFRSSKRAILL